mgnify:CR=1 FL=1
MNHPRTYRNQDVIVLGLARSGVAVAKLFHEYGARVTVNDKRERRACPEADPLEALGISVICGGHPEELIHPGISLVVKNPGIPYSIPPVRIAEALGIEVVSEVEVAYQICRAPIIGITGSNGKTTTTAWIGKMLDAAGLRPIVAGNIGVPLCEAAQQADPGNRMVVELSSFQLKGTRSFHPAIACLLNISETHLDYHGSMDDYIRSKAKLFANMTGDDVAVYNMDDETCRDVVSGLSARLLPFSFRRELSYGVYVERKGDRDEDGLIVSRDASGIRREIIPTSELGIPGAHNVENAMAAAAVALAAGAGLDTIARVLREFRGVEHRLEFVCEKDGVAYYNNSKATNAMATIKALESFRRPVVLIAGGQERKSDYLELLPYFRDKVKALVTLGETRHKINRVGELAGLTRIKSVDTGTDAADILDRAVRVARDFAESGDVVLLSPACASWDMFSSYEERGRIFKESVHKL